MFLFAKTIYEVMSPFSGRIRVIEQGHERRVIIGGYVQSKWNFAKGAKALHGTVWDGFLRFPFAIKPVPRTLILGLGGGTAACLLQDKFGSTLPIVGVDIDPEMINIARNFFGIKNVEIICQDAIAYVKKARQLGNKFDFIIVDLDKGDLYPQQAETEEFIANCKGLLDPGGVVVFNRIYIRNGHELIAPFLKILKSVFARIGSVIIPGLAGFDNILFFAQV